MSRLNAYKALSSPSLIALTSKDPILTAFKLSNQLKSLSKMESQFCKEYTVLREQVQVGATLTLMMNILHLSPWIHAMFPGFRDVFAGPCPVFVRAGGHVELRGRGEGVQYSAVQYSTVQ